MRDFSESMGFTYNGVHNSTMGCLWIPEADEIEYRYEEFDNNTLGVPKKVGEYDLEPTIKGKEISVKVYYEKLDEYEYGELIRWIRPTREINKIVFDNHNEVVYEVRLAKRPVNKRYEVGEGYSGIIEYRFDCPLGYGVGREINTEIVLDTEDSVVVPIINEGDYESPLNIKIKPNSKEITVKNLTNNEICMLEDLQDVAEIEIDTETGQIRTGERLAFRYHRKGYIELVPELRTQMVRLYFKDGGKNGKIYDAQNIDLDNKCIILNKKIYQILEHDKDGNIVLDKEINKKGAFTTKIRKVNHILIQGKGTYQFTFKERKM